MDVGIIHRIAYIHGMGGGADSRIPSILKSCLPDNIKLDVRTYDFDPDIAACQIKEWLSGFRPHAVIGESLGALHALCIPDIPKILVSPALGAPAWMRFYSVLAVVPGITAVLDRIYKPREGDRQKLHFTHDTLTKYGRYRRLPGKDAAGDVYAFFGKQDHYMKYGVVSVRKFRKLYGENYSLYDGTHFMEEEYVVSLLQEKILCITDLL